jgi:hypothetical protein
MAQYRPVQYQNGWHSYNCELCILRVALYQAFQELSNAYLRYKIMPLQVQAGLFLHKG